MAFRDRMRRIERRLGLDRTPRCEACGGRAVIEEIAPDGTVSYPFGPPCPVCGSSGSGRGVTWLTYDMRAPEDRPEEDAKG
jgi:hypothetical protein